MKNILKMSVVTASGVREYEVSPISGVAFATLWCSRRDIVRILAPAKLAPASADEPTHVVSLADPELGQEVVILPAQKFDPKSDWVLALAQEGGCDPGTTWYHIMGTLPSGYTSAYDLWMHLHRANSVVQQSHGTLPFERIDLPWHY